VSRIQTSRSNKEEHDVVTYIVRLKLCCLYILYHVLLSSVKNGTKTILLHN